MDEEKLPLGGPRERIQRPRGAEETLRVLNSFAVSLLQQNRLDGLLWSIADNIGQLLGYEDSVIYLVRDGDLHQVAALGAKVEPGAQVVLDPQVLPMGTGIVGQVGLSARPMLIGDTRKSEYYVSDGIGGLSEVTVPLLYNGRVLGVIDAESLRKNAFNEEDLRILISVANIAAPRLASALEEEQRRRAEEDLLLAKSELEKRVRVRTKELATNVQQLKREVEERRRIEIALAAEQHLLSYALASVGDGLFVVSQEGLVLLASDAALLMTGS